MWSAALSLRSCRSNREPKPRNSPASGRSSCKEHLSLVGMSRTAHDMPTAISVDLSFLDISSLRDREKARELPGAHWRT